MLKYIKNIIFLVVILCVASLWAAVPSTEWSQTFGSSGIEQGYEVVPTTDNGFVAVGSMDSSTSTLSDVFIVKTDPAGDTVWMKTYGGSSIEYGNAVQNISGGGFIICGATYSYGAGLSDVWLLKTDSNGDTAWTKTFGGALFEHGYSVVQTSDNGFMVTGYTTSSGAGGKDAYLIKTDADGNSVWSKTYGGTGDDYAYAVDQTSDGGFIITGYTASSGAGGYDLWILRTDSSGDTAWTKTYGGINSEFGRSVKQIGTGEFIVAGYTASYGAGSNDFWLLKIATDGDTVWTRTYGGTDHDYCYHLDFTVAGGYILGGKTFSYGAGRDDIWLVKVDANGDTSWTAAYGGTESDVGNCVVQTSSAEYIVTGHTKSEGMGNYDLYLLKLASDEIPPTPPDNDMTLTATAISDCEVELRWNPGQIDSADADSVGIWYRTERFPGYAHETGSTRITGFTLSDSIDTLDGLTHLTTYYFSLMARDSAGSWSDTVGTACDTAKTAVLDTFPPDNDMTLTASANGTDVTLTWNPGAIDSADADSVGIWYKKNDYPDSAGDGTAIRIAGFALTDSEYTITGLDTMAEYFFSLVPRDRVGNWANTVGSACDTATTRYPVWWDRNWERRINLTFLNTFLTDTLDSVPVLVKVYNGRIDYELFQDSGADIRFIDEKNVGELPYEIETWDTSGTSYVWVRVPEIRKSGEADSIWMYYGNTDAGDNQDTAGVWNSDFAGVWHLGNDILDHTLQNRNGTGSGVADTAGAVNGGKFFDGTDDYISINDPGNILKNLTYGTISFWARYDETVVQILSVGDTGTKSYYTLGSNNGKIGFRYQVSGTDRLQGNVADPIIPGTWYYIAMSVGASGNDLFVNGTRQGVTYDDGNAGSSLFFSDNGTAWDHVEIGRVNRNGGAVGYFGGTVDEVRISAVARDSVWIRCQYHSMIDSLIDWGEGEVSPDADTTAPDNDVTLMVTVISDSSVLLEWDPGAVDSADAESIGIWYRSDTYPGEASEPGAERVPGFTMSTVSETLKGLNATAVYYFSLMTADSSGNWSDTAGTACDTVKTQASWWDTRWARRTELRFSNAFLSDTLLDVPVLVRLHEGRINYSHFSGAGEDMRFVDIDDRTSLAFEIERWNPAGTSLVWVRVPDIKKAGTADSIWLYYTNPGAADGQDTAGTWDDDYTAVWHLGDDLIDHTGSARTCMNEGTGAAEGPAGAGRDFDGTDDYLSVNDPGSVIRGLTAGTISLLARYDQAVVQLVTAGDSDGISYYVLGSNSGKIGFRYKKDGLDQLQGNTVAAMELSAWTHIVFIVDGTGNALYVNGVQQAMTYDDGSAATALFFGDHTGSWDNVELGRINSHGNPRGFLDGGIDEIRISSVARDGNWITCQYRSLADSLIAWGDAEVTADADTVAPDNDMTLTATTLSETSIVLQWDPGDIDSADAESVGVWYRIGQYPGEANEQGATRLTGFALGTLRDTILGLNATTVYYFSLLVRDSSGNWSDTVGSACDTAKTDDSWWDGSWNRRTGLRFNNGTLSSAQDSVPVLVKLYAGRIDYGHFKGDGSDLRFIDMDDRTLLAHEVETWSPAGTSFIWVRVPQIAAAGTADSIWMYHDNPGAADTQDTTGVWNADFAGVWHLGMDLLDHSGNGRNAANNGTEAGYGLIDSVRVFDGGDHISINDGGGIRALTYGSISLWARYDAGVVQVFTVGDSDGDSYFVLGTNNGKIGFRYKKNGADQLQGNVSDALMQGTWYHILFTVSGSGNAFFINGAEKTVSYDDGTSATALFFGDNSGSWDNVELGRINSHSNPRGYFTGMLDEVRVSSVGRSAGWARCQYLSGMDSLFSWNTTQPRPKIQLSPEYRIPAEQYAGFSLAGNPAIHEVCMVFRPEASDIGRVSRIEIFDLDGHTVFTDVFTVTAAGRTVRRWQGMNTDGLPAAPGLYFYKARFGYKQFVGIFSFLGR